MGKKLNEIYKSELESIILVLIRNGYKIVVEKNYDDVTYNIFVLGEFDFNE